jgi:hypothetical protein
MKQECAMPMKRNLILAAIVALPLSLGACATNERDRNEASFGSSVRGGGDSNVQTARAPQAFRTNNQAFDYPNY